MPQVSKRHLPVELRERIFQIFWKSASDLGSPGEARDFLNDLLSETEKVMLAKRLTVALLLKKGYAYRKISDLVKVSTGTVMRVSNKLKAGGPGYRRVTKQLMRDEKIVKLLGKVEDVLDFLTESRPYSPRWIKEQKARRQRQIRRDLF